MTSSSDDDKNTRAIEKLRSWKEISKSAETTVDPTPDDYATELELFEQGQIDKALWAKHLVEMRGNEEEAKWNYIKDRVTTAPARRAEEEESRRKAAEEQKAKKEKLEAAEAELKRKAAEAEKKRKAAEAEKKRKAAEKARQERLKLLGEERERQRERAEEEARKSAEEAARRKAEEEAVKKAEAEEYKRKAAESWSKRAELNRERAEAHKSRLKKVMGLGGSDYQKVEASPEGIKVSEKASNIHSLPDEIAQKAATEEDIKGFLHESNSWFKTGLGYLALFLLCTLLIVALILDDDPSHRVAGQEEILETRAYELLQRSQDQFYGVTGRVDERAAASSALLALERLETLDSDDVRRLRDSINAWRVNILMCASSSSVRDLVGADATKRQVLVPSETDLRRIIFWDIYWGETSSLGSLESQDYRQLADEAKEVVSKWGLLNEPHTIELVNALELAAEDDHIAAYELAQFYECRTQNQEFELASDWYVRALENAKKTKGSSNPVDEDTIQMMRSRLERLGKVISATYLQ